MRYRGVAVGKVTSIGFDPQTPGNVLVRIAVDLGAPPQQGHLRQPGFQGVTGLAFVQLDDAAEAPREPLVASGDAPPRIPMRPGLMSNLQTRGVAILAQLEESSTRVNQLLQPDNQKALLGAINNLSAAAGSLQQLATPGGPADAGPGAGAGGQGQRQLCQHEIRPPSAWPPVPRRCAHRRVNSAAPMSA